MRQVITLFGLSITALLLTTSVQAHGPGNVQATQASMPATVRQAAAVVEAFHGSLRSGDLDAASALLAANALIYESGEVERSKAEYTQHHLPADVEFSRATVRTVTSQSGDANGDWAWIATESRTTGSYKGRTIDSPSTETMVLRRVGKIWKIVHIHWSSGR